MRTNEARLSVLALALALTGCWSKSHNALERGEGGAPGGPWSVCQDAAVHGVSGDTCAFPAGVTGCFLPQDVLDSIPERETPVGYGEPTFWTAAQCLSDREMLIRSERWESSRPGECATPAAYRTADGCIELRDCASVDTYCVPDALLPIAVEGPLVALDLPADCEALLEDAEARPGSSCSGEQICHVHFPSTSGVVGSYEPALVWCHAERLRFSSTYFFVDGHENVTTASP